MKLKLNVITRDTALAISPDYVAYAEGNFDKFEVVEAKFRTLRKGAKAITYTGGQFVRVSVSSVKSDGRSEDGPTVRVGNGEYTWRVDGNGSAWPV